MGEIAKKKVYQDAKCLTEWGTLALNGQAYTAVRISLTRFVKEQAISAELFEQILAFVT